MSDYIHPQSGLGDSARDMPRQFTIALALLYSLVLLKVINTIVYQVIVSSSDRLNHHLVILFIPYYLALLVEWFVIYMIAKAQNWARFIYFVLVLLSLPGYAKQLGQLFYHDSYTDGLIAILKILLSFGAIYFLFTSETGLWLKAVRQQKRKGTGGRPVSLLDFLSNFFSMLIVAMVIVLLVMRSLNFTTGSILGVVTLMSVVEFLCYQTWKKDNDFFARHKPGSIVVWLVLVDLLVQSIIDAWGLESSRTGLSIKVYLSALFLTLVIHGILISVLVWGGDSRLNKTHSGVKVIKVPNIFGKYFASFSILLIVVLVAVVYALDSGRDGLHAHRVANSTSAGRFHELVPAPRMGRIIVRTFRPSTTVKNAGTFNTEQHSHSMPSSPLDFLENTPASLKAQCLSSAGRTLYEPMHHIKNDPGMIRESVKRIPGKGLWCFFKGKDQLFEVRMDKTYSGNVKGVHIGDNITTISRKIGEPMNPRLFSAPIAYRRDNSYKLGNQYILHAITNGNGVIIKMFIFKTQR